MFYDKSYMIGYLTETVMIHQNNDANELILLQEKLLNLYSDVESLTLIHSDMVNNLAAMDGDDFDFARDYKLVCKTIIKNISFALLHNYYQNEDFTCAIGFLDKYIMEGGENSEK